MTEVVAALIWEGDKFMICQRPAHKARGLLWEFVGGKVEPGETKEQALVRECQEELAVTVQVGERLDTVEYDYPAFHLHMDCFWCVVTEGEIVLNEAQAARWLDRDTLPQVDWLPADLTLLPKLKATLRQNT